MSRPPKAEITDPGYRDGGITDGPRKFKPPVKKLLPETDYAEDLLQAIDTTVLTRIQQAKLDKTVLCTVLESDWTDVEAGEYYVSEGDAKYVAKGEANAYRTNDRVWVLIPQGDYNNQKTIISRQVGDVGDSFVYVSPLESFVRLTEDLIPNTSKGQYGLKTNNGWHYDSDTGECVIDEGENTRYVKIASIDMNADGAVDINGLSAFGVSAKFKTDLAMQEVMRGNYGLHIIINSTKEEITGLVEGKQVKEDIQKVDHLYLQCNDMWGNPYGYDMFFEQSKMFEINDPGRTKINNIDVYFFQTCSDEDPRNQADVEGAILAGKFVNINQQEVPVPEEDNLFVKELSMCFGYTADNLNTGAYLYSQNSPNFYIKDGNQEDINDKTLVAKFIYRDGTGKTYILNNLGDNPTYKQLLDSNILPGKFKVRWYIYNPQSTENDLRAGAGWEEITDLSSVQIAINASASNVADDNELITVIRKYKKMSGRTGLVPPEVIETVRAYNDSRIQFTSSDDYNCIRVDGYGSYTGFTKDGAIFTDTNRTFRLNDPDAGYEKFKVAFILNDNGLSGLVTPTDEEAGEAKAVIQNIDNTYNQAQIDAAQKVLDDYEAFQNEVRYWSQEVQFINSDDQTWGSLDTANSLKLQFDDGDYNGNYLIYDTATSGQAKMLNSSDAHVKRKVKGSFKSYINGSTDLTRSVIRWYIPKNATMISEPDWTDVLFSGWQLNKTTSTYEEVENLSVIWESLNGKIATYELPATEGARGKWNIRDITNATRPDTDIDTDETWNNYYIFQSQINTDYANKAVDWANLLDGWFWISYRIKEYWNQHFNNNRIMCKIVRDGKTYEKWVDLKFGAHGTNGTEYSLIVGLGDEYAEDGTLVAQNVPAWTRTHDRTNYITLKAQLYDERNKELAATYTWEIKEFYNALNQVNASGNPTNANANIFEISAVNDVPVLQIKESRRDGISGTAWLGAYLQCTATDANHRIYTQDFIVPVRSSENYIGCVGATKVTYTYANTAPAVSSKDKYQILTDEYTLYPPEKTTCVYDSTIGKPTQQTVNNTIGWYSDLPYLSNIKSSDVTQLATLILPSTYYADMNYNMVVKLTDNNGNIRWAQPILVTRDVYTNTFLNQWDGSLIIDNKNNRIGTAAVFAGKKNSNNTFTGVIMGELQGENPTPNETGYGIYGRNNGNHTFGINTNGTAYLGDTSHAQLLFKVGEDETNNTGWQSTIENKGYTDGSKKGMRLDFLGNTKRYGKSANMNAPYIDIISVNDANGTDNNDATRNADNTLNRVTISGNQDHLLEAYAHDKQVLHIGNAEYYLQTADYQMNGVYSTGTKLNLKTGEFLSYGIKDVEGSNANDHALLISNKGRHATWKVNGYAATDTDSEASGNQGGWVLYSHGNFGVDTTGKIFAQAGNIAGWNIDNKNLYTGALTTDKVTAPSDGAVRLSSGKFSAKINNHEGEAWRFTIGSKFGVTNSGVLYANGGQFNGGTISGGSITIGNNFSVDTSGNLTAKSAYLTSAYVSGEIHASSGSFTGSVTATSGSFTGTIYASGGTLGNVTINNTCSTSGLRVGGTDFSKQSGSIYYVNNITPSFEEYSLLSAYGFYLSNSGGDYSVSLSVTNGGNYVGTATLYYSYDTRKVRYVSQVNPNRYHYTFSYLGSQPDNNEVHD